MSTESLSPWNFCFNALPAVPTDLTAVGQSGEGLGTFLAKWTRWEPPGQTFCRGPRVASRPTRGRAARRSAALSRGREREWRANERPEAADTL